MLQEVLLWLTIGLGVGSILGLTGAGGAIFSVPLFINFVHATPKEATVLSLITVAVGSIMNVVSQRRNVVWKYSLTIGISSIFGSLVFFQVKSMSPDWIIAILFISVAGYGALNIWRPHKDKIEPPKGRAHFTFWVPLQGFFLGGLSTMTGLGGGIILVPWLKSKVQLPLKSAVATSLGSISLISVTSLTIQSKNIPENLTKLGVALLVLGVFGGCRIVKALVRKYEGPELDKARRVIFSMIVVYAVITLSARMA